MNAYFYVCTCGSLCEDARWCVALQADPGGPSFQTLFNSTEQTLKVGGPGFHGAPLVSGVSQLFYLLLLFRWTSPPWTSSFTPELCSPP